MKKLILILPLVGFLAAGLLWPLMTLFHASFQNTGGILAGSSPAPSLTLSNYHNIFLERHIRQDMFNSIFLSAVVAAGSTLICLGPAWLFARKEFFGKRLLRAIFTLPMSLSGVIVGFLVVIMLGRVGFIPQLFERLFGVSIFSGLAYQFGGIVLAYFYFEIPRATLSLESSFRKFDLDLEAAAKSLGADRWQRFRMVMLPLMFPALLSSFAVTFSVSLGSFGVILILSRRFSVLPVQIFEQFTAFLNTGLAAAMCVVLAILGFSINVGLQWWSDRREVNLHGAR